jgi:hypothetical protein
MSKSFHSKLRDALDASHLGDGRLSAPEHYALKRAMREANMSGRQYQDADELAQAMTGWRFQR